MDGFQDFISTFRPQHFAIGGVANLLINSTAMWLVVNHLIGQTPRVSFLRCVVCALLLYVVSSLSIALLLFPIPLILFAAVIVWLVGSLIVIRSVFELTYQGGGGILFLYLIMLVAVHGIVRQFVN